MQIPSNIAISARLKRPPTILAARTPQQSYMVVLAPHTFHHSSPAWLLLLKRSLEETLKKVVGGWDWRHFCLQPSHIPEENALNFLEASPTTNNPLAHFSLTAQSWSEQAGAQAGGQEPLSTPAGTAEAPQSPSPPAPWPQTAVVGSAQPFSFPEGKIYPRTICRSWLGPLGAPVRKASADI